MDNETLSVRWWLLGFGLLVANLVVAGVCLLIVPVSWWGLMNLGGAVYISRRLCRKRETYTKEEKLGALRRYREALMKLPADRDVHQALEGVDFMIERVRRQG